MIEVPIWFPAVSLYGAVFGIVLGYTIRWVME